MMHKSLKRFGMEGQVGDDSDFQRLRAQWEAEIARDMRDHGYVPVIDLGPFWSTSFNEETKTYEFVLSMHGLQVGRKRACQIEGVTALGKVIPRSTPPNKSNPSSSSAT